MALSFFTERDWQSDIWFLIGVSFCVSRSACGVVSVVKNRGSSLLASFTASILSPAVNKTLILCFRVHRERQNIAAFFPFRAQCVLHSIWGICRSNGLRHNSPYKKMHFQELAYLLNLPWHKSQKTQKPWTLKLYDCNSICTNRCPEYFLLSKEFRNCNIFFSIARSALFPHQRHNANLHELKHECFNCERISFSSNMDG